MAYVPGTSGNSQFVPSQSSHYYENGFRMVRPYFVRYTACVDKALIGRRLLDVLKSPESRTKDLMMLEVYFSSGRISVNGNFVGGSYILQQDDVIESFRHFHEPPVLDDNIVILHQDDELLVINKPCSIPVHPSAGFYHNSLPVILEMEYGISGYKMVNRLDILTSGLLVLPKTNQLAARFSEYLFKRQVTKEYLCLVEGVFPSGQIICNEPICRIKGSSFGCVRSNGQKSTSVFERLETDGKVSLVKCLPITGRSHQIRIHLQYLGYPIVGDLIYNNLDFGPSKGKHGIYAASDEELGDILHKYYFKFLFLSGDYRDIEPFPVVTPEEFSSMSLRTTPDFDPYCYYCCYPNRKPTRSDLTMYLHCLRYKTPDWEFSTQLPKWAAQMLSDGQNALQNI